VESYKLSYKVNFLFISAHFRSFALFQGTNGRWQFYTADSSTDATLQSATLLKGNSDAGTVQKRFVSSFQATSIRFHPIRWTGLSMALRIEVYVCVKDFDWLSVKNYLVKESELGEELDVGSNPVDSKKVNSNRMTPEQCSSLMSSEAVRGAFRAWTLGRGGSGAIYETTDEVKLAVGTKFQSYKAYQRRTVNDGGLMVKQLICFWDGGDAKHKKCCVEKYSKGFNGVHWAGQVRKTLLA
jgi:hypothetical protein